MRKGSVTWNPKICLDDVLAALKRQPVMSLLKYFYMSVPRTVLTDSYVTGRKTSGAPEWVQGTHAVA